MGAWGQRPAQLHSSKLSESIVQLDQKQLEQVQ